VRAPDPPRSIRRSRLDEREEWIERNAAQARRALLDPAVCAELLALLGVDDSAQRRERRLAEAQRDLASMELRWKLAEDEVWKP
jgi:hypothetical protein